MGYVHIKDLFLADTATGERCENLEPFLKPCLLFKEQDPLEQRLSEMQRKAAHMALVFSDDNRWTGIITLEDAIEEVIGTIEEEYPTEPTVRLSDLLTPEHTMLDVEGATILSATRSALQRAGQAIFPFPWMQSCCQSPNEKGWAAAMSAGGWRYLTPVFRDCRIQWSSWPA